jgi:outer membrane phospholipase A
MIKKLLVLSLYLTSIEAYAAEEDAFAKCAFEYLPSDRLACYDDVAKAVAARAAEPDLKTATAVAGSVDDDSAKESERSGAPRLSLARLETDDPNFFGFSHEAGSGDRGVETHIEFDISLKYPLWEWSEDGRLYFIYNGSYDFQALTGADIYDSSPIISTSQNPGAAFEWDAAEGRRKFRLGFFHHSNGQTLSETDATDITDPINENRWTTISGEKEFQRIEKYWGEAPALEQVSRSSWYLQLRQQWMSNRDGLIDDKWEQYQFELRHYVKTDTDIFWLPDPEPEHQPRLEDFDGIRFVAEKMYPQGDNLRLMPRFEIQTGIAAPLENIGGQFSLGFNFKKFLFFDTKNVWFSAYYYSGFAKDIASYHKRTKHAGFGLDLR